MAWGVGGKRRERDEDTPAPCCPDLEVTLFASAPFRCKGPLRPGKGNEFVVSNWGLPYATQMDAHMGSCYVIVVAS